MASSTRMAARRAAMQLPEGNVDRELSTRAITAAIAGVILFVALLGYLFFFRQQAAVVVDSGGKHVEGPTRQGGPTDILAHPAANAPTR
jgi:hypothetical protein